MIIRFDTEACNGNDRQLTFQYFTSFSVDLTTASADHECFWLCVTPATQQQKLLENKLQISRLYCSTSQNQVSLAIQGNFPERQTLYRAVFATKNYCFWDQMQSSFLLLFSI